jgi:hypothetical protein
MLNITGKVKVINIEDVEGKKVTKGTIYWPRKSESKNAKDGFETTFVPAKFVGKAFDQMNTVKSKTQIELVSATMNHSSRKDDNGTFHNYTELVVFEIALPTAGEGEKSSGNNKR